MQHHYTNNYVSLAEVYNVTFEAHANSEDRIALNIESTASEYPVLVSANYSLILSNAQLSQLADAIHALVSDYNTEVALAKFDEMRDSAEVEA